MNKNKYNNYYKKYYNHKVNKILIRYFKKIKDNK